MGHPSSDGESLLEDCKHVIRDYITQITVATIHLDGDIYRANLRPCPECYCENLRARVHWKEMAKSPKNFFRVEISLRGSSTRSIPPPPGDLLTLWDFLTSCQRMGRLALCSLVVTQEIKDKKWEGASWKAKGRGQLAGDDQSSSSSDNEDQGIVLGG